MRRVARRMETAMRLAPGGVPAVTYRMKSSRRHIRAGVRRRWTLGRCLGSRRTPVDRRVRVRARAVLIHAMQLVMLDRASRVLRWVRRRIASVDGTHRRNGVRILTMRMDGAVVRSAGTYFPVESILAPGRVMRGSVAHARRRLKRVVIVAKSRHRCCAVRRRKRWKARHCIMSPDRTRSSRNGLAALAAETPAIDRSTAACTSARKVVIHKTLSPPIARGPRILYPIALVGRLC
ncbi:conserved hypothetical protein [Aspergillus terreus NIH2624]|uniref:Uncharacterized protein n=1 Tax=Aspergillus terreus (strain NIH 2624 / FGSC A1156) TaxID=341663 RepID=Q0CPM6_ASPTN|nr:uncharacterized protein ATEG_04358 [Aspergillus terreus NIH2624]EAU34805.1 conserved hypothetical protein [Aspergillus terreus NIH2624]